MLTRPAPTTNTALFHAPELASFDFLSQGSSTFPPIPPTPVPPRTHFLAAQSLLMFVS